MAERKVDDKDLDKVAGGREVAPMPDQPGDDLGQVTPKPIGGGGLPPEKKVPGGGLGGDEGPDTFNEG